MLRSIISPGFSIPYLSKTAKKKFRDTLGYDETTQTTVSPLEIEKVQKTDGGLFKSMIIMKKYNGNKVLLHDCFKDVYGNYHDEAIYEIFPNGR